MHRKDGLDGAAMRQCGEWCTSARAQAASRRAARAGQGFTHLNCDSSGIGTSKHLSCEMFKSMARLDITRVPYKAIAGAQADVTGGRIEVMFDQLSTASQNARAGTVKALAITTRTRSPLMPDLPIMHEAMSSRTLDCRMPRSSRSSPAW